MLYLLPVIIFVLCIVSFFTLVDDKRKHTDNGKTQKFTQAIDKNMLIYCIIMLVVTVAASVLFCTLYKENNIFTSLKRLSLLCILWPTAYIDYKTYRIPNAFIVLGLIYRAVIFAFELFLAEYNVWATLLSEVIASAALLLASLLCSLCIKHSVGYGDIKLFVVMGLLLSLDAIWSAIFMSLIISLIISVWLLATKKKNRKDVIPFGPALAIGAYLSVCLSGM